MKIFYILFIVCSFFSHSAFSNLSCIISQGLQIQTKNRKLMICEHGKIVESYKIAIGRGGIGKFSAGDNKTPIGIYNLGQPRQSPQFGTFVPIHYPTKEQKLRGYTGHAIGIHGPHRRFSWLKNLNVWFNWTQGCIAVSDDSEIKSIAQWIKKHPQAKILIE